MKGTEFLTKQTSSNLILQNDDWTSGGLNEEPVQVKPQKVEYVLRPSEFIAMPSTIQLLSVSQMADSLWLLSFLLYIFLYDLFLIQLLRFTFS